MLIVAGLFPSATNARSNVFSVLERAKDSAGLHHDSNELTGMATTRTTIWPEMLAWNADTLRGARASLIASTVSMHTWPFNSSLHSSFRFRFPHVLRVQEDVQVADGAEPACARGMRQDLVHLSVLSQRHADEVQSVEPPQEGARLRHENLSFRREASGHVDHHVAWIARNDPEFPKEAPQRDSDLILQRNSLMHYLQRILREVKEKCSDVRRKGFQLRNLPDRKTWAERNLGFCSFTEREDRCCAWNVSLVVSEGFSWVHF